MDEAEEYKEFSARSKEREAATASRANEVSVSPKFPDKNHLVVLFNTTSSSAIAHVRSVR